MVEVTLREYLDEIESLAEEGAFDAVIGHCQHILKAQPRYLPAYSLMGKTALEMDDLEAAADLFSRVLSMDPEDFVARVGMSIASDKEGSVAQATWHMERAYELAPDNQAIAAELRRLYGRRDGVEPEKIALTQAALARLHSRGNLFSQAINEFRQLLAREPERVDLEVALAETLWRADRRIEAAETSLSLLEKLPYCLKANLILGEIWSSSGREAEGAAHLKRAQSIDPENVVAQELFGERSPLSPRQVHIARMEYVAPPAPAEQEPDWLQSLVRDSAATEATDEAVPDWLQAVATSAAAAEILEDDQVTRESDLLPDWLQDVAATADVETEAFVASPEIPAAELVESEMPDWLVALTGETEGVAEPLAPDEIPESVQEVPSEEEPDALLEEQLSEMAAPDLTTDTESAVGEEAAAVDDALPDWLAAMATDEFEITDEERAEAEISDEEELDLEPAEVPDWLAAMADEQAQVTEAEHIETETPIEEEMESEPDELPDWLTEPTLEDQQIGESEDLDLAPAEIPDWLAEMAPPETASTDVTELDLAPAGVPDWLVEEEPSAPESTAEEPPEEVEETPDWLSELVEAAGATMAEETPEPEQLVEPDEALPEWLVTTDAEEPAPADVAPEIEPVLDIEPDVAPSDDTAAGPVVIEEPEKERLVYPEGAGGEVTEAEAELLANLEEMSPEEAFAAWEAMLAQSELEEATPEADTARATGPIIIEEPEKEKLVYPEGAGGEVTEAEAALLADLEEMSPEEAFAAWEAMLAAEEAEEAVSEPEAIEPTAAAEMITPEIIEEEVVAAVPEADLEEQETVAEAEAELLASLEDMSPEEAFATWEAMLAEEETEKEVTEPEAIEPAESDMVIAEITEEEVLAVTPEVDVAEEEIVTEAELQTNLEDMSPEEAIAAWEAALAEGEEEKQAAEAELRASLEDMPPEEAAAAWEAVLAEGEGEEETGEEAEMLVSLEDMSPEEAAVAWEAVLAEEDEEQAATEAELLPSLEDMPPEEAFAAWEAMLAEGEEEEIREPEGVLSLEELEEEPAPNEWPEEEVLSAEEIESEAPEAALAELAAQAESLETVAEEPIIDEDSTLAEAEAELLASLEDLSPEEAQAAWEALVAEEELIEEAVEEETSPIEPVAEAEDIWMPLAEDEIEEAIALGEPVTEVHRELSDVEAVPETEELTVEPDEAWMTLAEDEVEETTALGEPEAEAVQQIEEPTAELDEAWMTLAEDELVEEEMLAPAISEEDEAESEAVEFEATIVESIPPDEAAVEAETEEETTPASEISAEIEDLEPAIPAWAFAQAIEPAMPTAQEEPVDTTTGPDVVFLTEEEEAEVRVTQERITAPEAVEAALVEEQPEEEAPPDEVESVQPPTWVALEEEPEAQVEAAAPKAQEVELEMIEPEDDESRLMYARQLWAKGKKADARDEYENLLRTPLRDEATADLEKWAAEAPDEPLLRLLGDAYIKQDRLDEALEAYRRALSSL